MIPVSEVLEAFSAPTLVQLARAELHDLSILKLLVQSGLARTNCASLWYPYDHLLKPLTALARQLLSAGAVSLNNVKVKYPKQTLSEKDLLDGKYVVVRAGKVSHKIIVFA